MITCYFEDSTKAVNLRHLVTDMLIIKNQQILLVKRDSKYIENNKWALPGGFVEQAETILQAAKREAQEETGYLIKNLKLFYINDNPHRPREKNRNNIAIIILAAPHKQVSQPDHEIKQVKWFDLNQLPPTKTIAFDHLKIINLYKQHLNQSSSLPILK